MADDKQPAPELPAPAAKPKPAAAVPAKPKSVLECALVELGLTLSDVARYTHIGDTATIIDYMQRTHVANVGKMYDKRVEAALVEHKIDRKDVRSIDRDEKLGVADIKVRGRDKPIKISLK